MPARLRRRSDRNFHRHPMRRGPFAIGAMVSLTVGGPGAQQPAGRSGRAAARPTIPAGQPTRAGGTQPPPPVTFKTEVNYVEVDALVTDAQGNFVARADQGRLRGPRGQQAAEDRAVHRDRHPGRKAGAVPLLAARHSAGHEDEPRAVPGAAEHHRARRPAHQRAALVAGQARRRSSSSTGTSATTTLPPS